MAIQVIKEGTNRPIRIWTKDVEPEAMVQLKNMSGLPFLHQHGLAVMPDVHAGKGSTVGTVIATDKAIIPAAVGVDIGCGMNAVRTSLKASDLPDSLSEIRSQIERDIPLGAGGAHKVDIHRGGLPSVFSTLPESVSKVFGGNTVKALNKAVPQLGTLGSGK